MSLLSCSKGGDEVAPATVEKEENKGSVLDSPQYVLGTVIVPGLEFGLWEVWVYDHTSPKFERIRITSQGQFKIPMALFGIERIYSFHVMDQYKWIGSLVFGNGAAQSEYLKYQGGLGFDLGEIKIPLDSFGKFNRERQPLATKVGGGFALLENPSKKSFLDFHPFEGLSHFDFGSSLRIRRPVDLLYSYILATSNPNLYLNDINNSTHLVLRVQTTSPEAYQDMSLIDSEDSLQRSSLVDESFEPNNDFWRLSSFLLDKEGSEFLKRFYIGRTPNYLSSVVLRLVPKVGSVKFLPVALQDRILMPPMIQGVAYNGLTPDSNIDYADSKVLNGLTAPFCIKSGMRLRIGYPKIESKRSEFPLEILNIRVTYLMENPQDPEDLVPAPTDFPETFQKDLDIDNVTKWLPKDRSLVFEIEDIKEDFVDINIPDQIFLKGIRGKDVKEHRLEVLFKSLINASETSSTSRFKYACQEL
jgi:hypothetical protein